VQNKRAQRPDYANVPVAERKRMVERVYVNYPRNKDILKKFTHCHEHSKDAAEPEGLLLEGPAGMGKTTLLKHYLTYHPRKWTEKGAVVPVLATRIEVPASPKSLVTALLRSLGDPLPDKGSTVSQTIRLKNLMEDCGVEIVMLDEFQHFIDRDSKKILKTTSDWLKNLMDDTHKPIILSGMPYSHGILDAEGNEQLRRRFSTRISLDPFGWVTRQERQDFRRFLEILDEHLPLEERSNLSDEGTAFRFFAATGGVVSKVMVLVRRASVIALDLGRKRLDLEVLSRAYAERLATDAPKNKNPFADGGGKQEKESPRRDKSEVRATNARSKAKEKKLNASDVL
jgi:Bacterial TniB protein